MHTTPTAVMAHHHKDKMVTLPREELVLVCGEDWCNRGNYSSVVKVHKTHTCCCAALTGDLLDLGTDCDSV